MSIRSSGAFSAGRSVAAGLALAAALSLAAPPPASAQQLRRQLEELTVPQRGPAEPQVDAVTRAIQEDPLGPLRLAAYSLKRPDDRGLAVTGLIAALLAQDQLKEAKAELNVLGEPEWRARALIAIADYYRRDGRGDAAARTLQLAASTLPAKPPEGGDAQAGATLRLIAERRAEAGDFAGALAAANRIPLPAARAEMTLRLAKAQMAAPSRRVAAGARKSLAAAFRLVKAMKNQEAEAARFLLEIGRAQIAAGDAAGARATFARMQEMAARTEFEGRDRAMADLAAAQVAAGNRVLAMNFVRNIKSNARRAMALASVAGALGRLGSIDSAVPLFDLALQQAKAVSGTADRDAALQHILEEQTRVDRLADAFNTAGQIRDRLSQSRALLSMGMLLLEAGKTTEAMKLVDFIPFLGLRAPIFVAVARLRGDAGESMEASALLARALESTGRDPQPELLADGLEQVIDAQLAVGAPAATTALFDRVRELGDGVADELTRIRVLARLARAEALLGEVEESKRSLAAAYRLAWLHRDDPDYSRVLIGIVEAQLAAGDLLQAFDTAARIPDGIRIAPQDETGRRDGEEVLAKHRALRQVAVAAADRDEGRLALRAARLIPDTHARAEAFAALAVAIGKRERGRAVTPVATTPARPATAPPGG